MTKTVSLNGAPTASGQFVELAKLMVHSHVTGTDIRVLAEQQRVGDRVKAAVAGGSVGDPNWAGSFTPASALASAFAESLRNSSVFDRMMADSAFLSVPMRQVVGTVVLGATAGPAEEGRGKPVTKLSVTAPRLVERKVAGIMVITDELAKATSRAANAMFARELRAAVTVAMNSDFLSGLIDHTGIASLESIGSDVEAISYDAARMLAAVDYGANAKLYWVGGTDIARDLATKTGTSGRAFPGMSPVSGGTWYDLPFLVADEVGEGNLMLIDASQIASDSLPLTLRTSSQANIQMADNPDMDATAGTASAQSVSLYQTGSVAILAERVYATELLRDGAVAVLTGVDYQTTETA